MRGVGRLTALALALACSGCSGRVAQEAFRSAKPAGRAPRIRPDYAGTVLPPNIAPTNFAVEEPGTRYVVRVEAGQSALDIVSRGPKVIIPIGGWRRLLAANRGQELRFTVYARAQHGSWSRYEPIANRIADEPIDRCLVYRQIDPAYNYWKDIAIRERDLESYHDRVLLPSKLISTGCINCHSAPPGRPDALTIGLRSQEHGAGTVLLMGGRARKLSTKFGYTAWHPSRRIIMFSDNEVRQFFHTARPEVRDVLDVSSDLAYVDLAARVVKTQPAFSRPDQLETYPTWSPDGKWLYYSSAPCPPRDPGVFPPPDYATSRYSLMRISYDLASDAWGKPETVLSADKTGRSLLLARVSPNGRFVLFCACDYGCFPIYQPSSDLWLMDLTTRAYRRLSISSPRSESWHSWSSNSRWIAFSSKRRDGLFTRTYISYVDPEGRVSKPFILPQRDPTAYDSLLKTYSVPELMPASVPTTPRQLAMAVRAPTPEKLRDERPKPAAAQSAGPPADVPWRQAR
jgi:WD40-like Beta Propeller Repeat